ncbi:copper homeostasis protein CutC [Winogradskya humida]|uniref:Copper homeostasis protein cutC homolog n=1 Tax=Winogradskya humida TaxID=113566 RepID=A0ABQ3ZVB0_9ACTN|nr:copper homeostasis protein CutC [Actinoplanes humidus]GIE22511.1 copper homeostasis protein CutC [Actinoplanes humidus]
MPESILEVIALSAADARAATAGGADRLELVADISAQGLTPAVETFASVRAATDLPVRVMLRDHDGYALSAPDALTHAAVALRSAGASEFVLGFLDEAGNVDLPAVTTVLAAIDGCSWTFHRAIDHATDRTAAWSALDGLPGLDGVLTAGSPKGVENGLGTLLTEASATPPLLVGGGLRQQHLAPLRDAGVRAFHTGSAVRPGGSWHAPVDADLVRLWRDAIG